jgi:hypothetical protein
MPKPHWRLIRRHRDLIAILTERCGRHLPDDDAGGEYLPLLINALVRLMPHSHAVARANKAALGVTRPDVHASATAEARETSSFEVIGPPGSVNVATIYSGGINIINLLGRGLISTQPNSD